MVVHGSDAPPTSWSKRLVQPKINETAQVHPFSSIIGDVSIGANVLIAPGTSVRANEGGPFYIGEGSHLQDGVVVHGLEQGRVVGADQQSYSVWVGKNTSIAHMALVHGPVYIGDNCFIGFRSTVFNARIGDGCIIMMHALVQDVELPPGKYVPSGTVVTSQQQADRLPDVQDIDQKIAAHMVGTNQALRAGYHSAETLTHVAPIRKRLERAYQSESIGSSSSPSSSSPSPSSQRHNNNQMVNTRLSPEVVEQVRQLLAQGLKIGTEYADKRRFQTSSWTSCTPISSNREADVLTALEACVNEHPDAYIRLFGIDARAKRRISELIIQRPGQPALGSGSSRTSSSSYRPTSSSSYDSSSYSSSSRSNQYEAAGSGRLGADVMERVRHFLSQGYKIGTEHADKRRFQTSSWTACSPIQTTRESDAIAALENCLSEHAGEYVRLFGIDPQAKRRVSELIIQRPGDKNGTAPQPSSYAPSSRYTPPHSSNGGATASRNGTGHLAPETVQEIRQLLSQGYRVSAEHADTRRFQTSSWKSCAPIQSSNSSEVIAALESCLAENSGEYVRVIGIDTKSKRRVAEMIVQRP